MWAGEREGGEKRRRNPFRTTIVKREARAMERRGEEDRRDWGDWKKLSKEGSMTAVISGWELDMPARG